MELHHAIVYPADVETVYAMQCEDAFRKRVCAATGALEYSVEVVPDPTGASITTVRVMPPDVPDAVRRLVGDHIEIRQQERWSGADAAGRRSAEVALTIAGTPASMAGVILLEPTSEGSRQTVSGDVRVRVPFIGGVVEPQIGRAIRLGLDKEAEVGRAWLAGDADDAAPGG